MRKLFRLFLVVSILGGIVAISGASAQADAGHVLTIDDLSQAEGNSGAIGAAVVTVHLDPAPAAGERVKVDFGTSAIGATAASSAPGDVTPSFPEDYAQTDGTLTFEATETSKVVAVPTREDVAHEPDESFFMKLFNARGECVVPGTCTTAASIGDNKATVTLTNDDAQPTIAVDDVSHDEGDADTTTYSFTVTKTNGSAKDVTVHVATANDTAAAPDDYTTKSTTITFPAGNSLLPETASFDVDVKGDETYEANETFKVMLTDATNASVTDALGAGTITNDDPVPPPTVTVQDASGAEGEAVNPLVKLGSPPGPGQTATVDWALVGTETPGSATPGTDYTAASGSLVFTAGEDEQAIPALTIEDAIDELNETFTAKISRPVTHGTGGYTYTIGDDTAVATIDDDDAAPALSISDVNVDPEGTATSTAVATFTVTKTGATDRDVTVDYATIDDTATDGDDYTAKSGTLTFTPEETSKQVAIELKGDDLDEVDETFKLNLTNAANSTISDALGVATITDDDTSSVTLAVSDLSVTEGNTGTALANFAVTKTGVTGKPVTVKYATGDWTAKKGLDYDEVTGTLTFAPNETSKFVAVPIRGDVLDEANETYTVNLSLPTNAAISDALGGGVITDNDAAPAMSIGSDSVNESATEACTVLVKLSAASGREVNVSYTSVSGTAGTADYVAKSGTVKFVPGDTAEQIKILARADSKDEPTEKFTVKLSGISPSGSATFANTSGTCSIIDND